MCKRGATQEMVAAFSLMNCMDLSQTLFVDVCKCLKLIQQQSFNTNTTQQSMPSHLILE
jgi:hypothetical protein